MNIILDIDETFVQYVGHADWAAVDEAERKKYETGGEGKNGLFILRPHFDTFFTYLFENAKTVNLWTWSDKEYAEGVKSMIESRNPKWKIKNVWADNDVEASIRKHGHNKDLNYIWYPEEEGADKASKGKAAAKKKAASPENDFKPCNTILIDDLPKNTNNPSNKRNGIQIPPFHPLGKKLSEEDRTNDKIRTGKYTDQSNDGTLPRVIEVLKNVRANPKFCEKGDLPHPFEEHVNLTQGGRRRRTTRRYRKRRATRKYRR
jgi:hypothetical protein